MYKYTHCFIRQGNKLLMLNRDSTPAKGLWNGVGGKINGDESPHDGILRETFEETGISIKNIEYRGVIRWNVDNTHSGGMHVL